MAFVNGTLWHDASGAPLHAHGGWMLQAGGYYYWYGEDRSGGNYVSCYRSKDMSSWAFVRHSLTVDSPVCLRPRARGFLRWPEGEGEKMGFDPTSCYLPNLYTRQSGARVFKVNIERPKVLFCQKTGQYVMWAHYENGFDYREACCCVSVSDRPDGAFTFLGAFNPISGWSKDCTIFTDTDGKNYFISTSQRNLNLHVYEMTDDCLDARELVKVLWPGETREAPAFFLHEGKCWCVNSGCSGWKPNQCAYATADRFLGEWSALKPLGDETTYDSQPAFITRGMDGRFVYFGDRWGDGVGLTYAESGYVVLPLRFEDGELRLDYCENAPL